MMHLKGYISSSIFIFCFLSLSVAFGMLPAAKKARAETEAEPTVPIAAAIDHSGEYVGDAGGGGGAAAEPVRESVDILEKRIRLLSAQVDNALVLSRHVRDAELQGVLVGFLTNLNSGLEEIIKFRVTSEAIPHHIYKRELQSRFSELELVFNHGKDRILSRAHGNGTVIALINDDLQPCFAGPFQPTLDEVQKAALERELVFSLNKIPQIPGLPKKPTCFISYAWGHPGHTDWVFDFYKHLVATGLDAHIDRVNNESGSISAYISNIETDDHILVIGTPELRQKYEAHRQAGGGPIIGTELQMIHSRYMRKNDSVIKMILAGAGAAYAECFTSILGGDIAAYDFRHQVAYYENLFKVIKRLYQVGPQAAGVMEQIEAIKVEFMYKVARMNEANTHADIQRILSEWEAIRLQQEEAKKKGLA